MNDVRNISKNQDIDDVSGIFISGCQGTSDKRGDVKDTLCKFAEPSPHEEQWTR